MNSQEEKRDALNRLKTPDPDTRRMALEDLEVYPDRDVTDAMLETLSDIDISVRGEGYNIATLILELAKRGDNRCAPKILDILAGDLENGDDHQIPEAACEAFRTLNSKEALPFLRNALLDQNWEGYEDEIAETLAKIGGRAEEEYFLQAISSRRRYLKLAGLNALREVGTEASISRVEFLTASKSEEIRFSALITLAVLCPSREVEIVEDIVASATDFQKQSDLVRAAGHLRNKVLIEQLVAQLKTPKWDSVHFSILKLLEKEQHPELRALLLEVRDSSITSPSNKIRADLMLLNDAYDDSLAQELLSVVLSGQGDFDHKIPGEIMVALLSCTRSHPRRFLEVVLLLDDVRRERLKGQVSLNIFQAKKMVDQVVGSEYFKDYDTWVQKYREEHELGDVKSPAHGLRKKQA